MITFTGAIVLLILAYFIYGKITERIFGADKNRPTPAITMQDGIDYVPLPCWKIFMIQFLNIAGLGPIFGAIMGIMFGTSAFLWIVFGTIFGGAVHDYLSGMYSIRMNGASLPEIVQKGLGKPMAMFMRLFSVFLMVMVGAVFISGPAGLLSKLISEISITWWILIIFVYYFLATMLPIDKLIGKLYPIFGFALLFMAFGILIALYANNAPIPEIWHGLENQQPQELPIFPMMFISIACGAISGFHATQSPMMARCLVNERLGRPVFFGAMIAEGIVTLIWAAAAASFFGSIEGLQNYVAGLSPTTNKPAMIVEMITKNWLGVAGGFLAMLGVIFAPITSGDTALRSARLIVADFLKFDQKSLRNRLIISIPLFIVTYILLNVNFDILWRYFAWSNQTLAAISLWTFTVLLRKTNKWFWITFIPAVFMTATTLTYICFAPEGLNMPYNLSSGIGIGISFILAIWFLVSQSRTTK